MYNMPWIQMYVYIGGDLAQLVRQRIFLRESTFSADSLAVSVHLPLAIACIYISAHVENSVAHVRVRWIMETLKHPVCTVGWLARPCRSWLSPGKAIRISHRRNSIWTIQLWKVKVKKARLPFPLSTPNPNYSCSPFAQQGKSVKRVFQDFAVMLGNRQTFCWL